MRSKKLLFFGIVLLIAGIVIRKLSPYESMGLLIILVGILCKTVYIVSKVRSGEYHPGKELFYLGIGLVVFLSGLFLRKSDADLVYPIYMIVGGLLLKLIFIIKFIQLTRSNMTIDNSVKQ